MSVADATRLKAMLGTYPKTQSLKNGTVLFDGVALDFVPIDDAVNGFKQVVREADFGVAELALSTFLQARSIGKPYVLLPFVMNGKFHHASLLRRSDNEFGAHQLHGRRVAMRSYSQTTPTWVRGFLTDDFGIQLDQVHWRVQGGGHVAECADPPWVSRMDAERDLFEALYAGEVDAILFGGKRAPDPRVATVLPDPAAAANDWSRRNHAVPVNHMVAVHESLARDRPELVRAIYAALVRCRLQTEGPVAAGELDPQPHGFDNVRAALEIGIRYAVEQALVPKQFSLDEIYGHVQSALAGIA
jgi:4,5-dihydroxyphthalate decarboxylase